MNEPEDRPTSDRPDSPDAPPSATWEDVVDPVATPPADPVVDPGEIALPGTWPEPRPPRQPPTPPPSVAPPAADPRSADTGTPAAPTRPPVARPGAPAAPPRPPAAAPTDAPTTSSRPPAPAAPATSSRPAPPRPTPRPAVDVADDLDTDEADDLDDDDYYDDEEDDEPISRWASLMATIGTALIGIVTVQVLASLVEGLTLKKGERVQIPDDILHRLGYPFGGLGSTALVFLVLGVALVSLPSLMDEVLSQSQDRLVGVALIVAVVMGVIIAIGSLLAVRANLHEYSAKGVAVPSYVRVQFTNFLLGALGAAALALFGAITAMSERSRERG